MTVFRFIFANANLHIFSENKRDVRTFLKKIVFVNNGFLPDFYKKYDFFVTNGKKMH